MRTIIGYLLAPDNAPLSGTLTFVALQSMPVDLPQGASTAITLDDLGHYSVDVQRGYYTVHYAPPRGQGRLLGRVVITDGPPLDVLTLIGAEQVPPAPAQAILDQMIEAMNQAVADAAAAAEAVLSDKMDTGINIDGGTW